jgi:excisionase family DNA binding protein
VDDTERGDTGEASARLLTEDEAAAIVGVSPFTLARERKRGRIAYHRPGGHVVRYSRSDVQAYIASTRRAPQQEKAS